MGGGDADEASTGSRLLDNLRSAQAYYDWGLRWDIEIPKPLIGAINGYCLGRGFEYALHCDMLLASDRAVFGLPENRGGGIAMHLPFWVNPAWAKRIAMTGDHVSAETAKRIGLVLDIVPHEKLMDEAFALAKRFTYIPPHAIRFNKRMIDGTVEAMGKNTALAYQTLLHAICGTVGADFPRVRYDGLDLEKVRQEQGLRGFIHARDEPFGPSPHL
jgi:enoyl-CoA hydratase/carnithine racemase